MTLIRTDDSPHDWSLSPDPDDGGMSQPRVLAMK